eukprot:5893191-Amphidinium_carterae.1
MSSISDWSVLLLCQVFASRPGNLGLAVCTEIFHRTLIKEGSRQFSSPTDALQTPRSQFGRSVATDSKTILRTDVVFRSFQNVEVSMGSMHSRSECLASLSLIHI